jgi:hypothetical protein
LDIATDKLISGIPIPHTTNGAIVFPASGATAVAYSATNAAGATIGTNGASVRFAFVHNHDDTANLYVNVGNTVNAPAAATAGSYCVPPRSMGVFQMGGGYAQGCQMVLNVISSASGSSNGSIQWVK